MTPIELIRAEIARIEERHRNAPFPYTGDCIGHDDNTRWPCDAIRLAGMLRESVEALDQLQSVRALWHPSSEVTTEVRMRIEVAAEALSRISALVERSNG